MSNLPVLENSDKKRIKKEQWSDAGRTLACIPHPSRVLALGGVGRGKTNTLKLMFLEHQKSKNPFKELIVVSPTTSSEWDDAQPTMVISDLPPPEIFNPDKKTLLVIDDWEAEGINTAQKRLLSTLFRYVSSHCNVSIYLSFQTFMDCPPIARKCATSFVLWDCPSRLERSLICNRVGLPKGTLDYLFKEIASGPYDNITVDRSVGTPAFLRKNLYEKIDEEDINRKMKKIRIKELRNERSALRRGDASPPVPKESRISRNGDEEESE